MPRLFRAVATLAVLIVAMAACTSESVLTAERSSGEPAAGPTTTTPADPTPTPRSSAPTPALTQPPPTPTPSLPVTLDEPFSHRDVARARAGLALAEQRWQDDGPDHYVMRVDTSCECEQFSLELIALDGVVVGRTVRWAPEAARRANLNSIEDVFDRADALIARLESDPSKIPTGECDGAPFTLRFDPATGAPLIVGNNTPCDGGSTWSITLTPIDRTGQQPTVDQSNYSPIGLSDLENISLTGEVSGLVFEIRSPDVVDQPPQFVEVGEPCPFGASSDECQSTIDLAVAGAAPYLVVPCAGCPRQELRIIGVFADGGPPRAIEDHFSFADAVGPIDTPTEAALLVGTFGNVRPTEEGFEVVTSELLADCDPIVERAAVFTVDRGGWFTEIDRWFTAEWGICI